MKKVILSFILIISILFISGCDYTPSWKKTGLTYYGKTDDYIISTDSNGNFHISEINRKSIGKNEFTIPKIVIIDNEEIEIDYVDNIFSGNNFLRKVTIEFNKHEIKFNKCYNLKIIEIDESNIVNPSTLFSSVKGKYIYITNQTQDYSIYTFYNQNTVFYQQSPTSSYTSRFIQNDLKTLNLIIINLLIGILGGILLLIYHKVYGPFHSLAKTSAILLFLMPIITLTLCQIFINNLIWILGIFFVIPFILGINAFMVLDDSNLFKILLIPLALASTTITYIFIYPTIIPYFFVDVYVTTLIFLLVLAVIMYILTSNDTLTIIGIIIIPILITLSYYLLDLMYYYGFKELITSIICCLIQGISYFGLIIAFVLIIGAIVVLFVDYTVSSYTPTFVNVPHPKQTPKEQPIERQEISIKLLMDYAYKIPSGNHWEHKPDIYINGTINLFDSSRKDEYLEKESFCRKILKDRINSALNKYYKENPNGYRYDVHFNINYIGKYYE